MTQVFQSAPGRPVVMGRNGAVSSGHSLASLAGLSLLKQGGNAFDAAVAVAAALNVVEPTGSGLGGDSFILLHNARSRKVHTINSAGPAPRDATAEKYRDGIPGTGPLSVSVPGAFSGWVALVEKFGNLTLRDALAPAKELAENGFPVSYNLVDRIRESEALLKDNPTASSIFFPGGRRLEPQDLLKQEDLANTFERLGAGGHSEFYEGELAVEICSAVQEAGGLLDRESLASYRAEVVEPLSTEYRGYTVFAPAPNSTGHVLLQELRMFEHYDPADFEPLSPELVHLMVEMKKIAFADRERYNADPKYVGALPDHLLSREYARECIALIDASKARPAGSHFHQHQSDDTTYFAVVDRDGNAVSMTTSINGGFGSGFIAGRTGFFLNNRMRYWHLDPGHPNHLTPGKRVRHTVSPAMVFRDGEPAIVIGTPGADGQVQTIFQVLVNILDYGVNPQLAVEMPRWKNAAVGQESNFPHGDVEELAIEARYPERTLRGLIERGHNVAPTERLGTFGSCQVIRVGIDSDGFTFGAAADPRRDGYAVAW